MSIIQGNARSKEAIDIRAGRRTFYPVPAPRPSKDELRAMLAQAAANTAASADSAAVRAPRQERRA